ncbi:MBL fold metallo-hydrolase [Gordonia sp. AC31]|uniref:MBL fold metallo-hydrolase n=1 Tax=Gordonia sp. AC31 TaxID=2962571 RepID=UPI002880EF36|nr:MBL fold metallo-hydrolase [Gordonia sp. AC31]MDT0222905.1 MBL fold metallo-hydrolase [Gordonia sp. AC31]
MATFRQPGPAPAEMLRTGALAVRGAFRPRPPDRRLFDAIEDAGLPDGEVTVRVRALPQVARRVPLAGLVEGARTLRRASSAMTTFVVEHPEATFLVDPGFCRDAHHRVLPELPTILRPLITPPRSTVSTADGLELRPLHRSPDFALPTHAHWDHVCGLLDLPGLPVWLPRAEREWILAGSRPPVGGVRAALTDGRPILDYELDGPPVSTFAASHDLFGDGSVVVVDLGGHPPGSVGVLARTSSGPVLLAGDAAWHFEQVARLRQKPSIPGEFVDDNRDAAFAMLHRLHLARHTVRVIPTHDHDAVGALCG